MRGPTYQRLRELGFVLFYPALDDYAFLLVSDENKKFLNKQMELSISFLKSKKGLTTISGEELDRMRQATIKPEQQGSRIRVISGTCAGLEGKVLEQEEQRYRCELQGFNRIYTIWVDQLDLVFIPDDEKQDQIL